MTIYRMHAEVEGQHPSTGKPISTYWCNALVFAEDETKACRKFRELFRLDDGVTLRIEAIEHAGILVI